MVNQQTLLRVRRFILKYRWFLMSTVSAFIIIMEWIEHVDSAIIDANFIREFIVFGLIIPFSGGIILSLLAKTEQMLISSTHYRKLEHYLTKHLSTVQNWSELKELLLNFPRLIAEFVGISIYVQNRTQNHFESAAEWVHPNETVRLNSPLLIISESNITSKAMHLVTTNQYAPFQLTSGYPTYCLPLIDGDQMVAIVYLFLKFPATLWEDQFIVLNNCAPMMASAINNIHPLGLQPVQKSAIINERMRIARLIHDTLAQNLSYLVIKLDELTGENVLQEIAAIRQELSAMHRVASQTYEQVRANLAGLQPVLPLDLAPAMQQLIQTIGNLSRLSTTINQIGSQSMLNPNAQHKIMGIVQEAFYNIDHHANARQIDIELEWTNHDLSITISDDGSGFDLHKAHMDGHFGLAIMKARTEELNGRLSIDSLPNIGTIIKLWIPVTVPEK
jgi:signal transduction histidine kinase